MNVLVLAGGNDQIRLLQLLGENGFRTILADYNENPIAAPYAAVHYKVSTLDLDSIIRLAKKENVKYILTVCTDQALLIAAQASEILGLFFPLDYAMARNLTNKRWMKDVLVHHKIPTSPYIICNNKNEILVESLRYPLVVKPVDSNSSKGVIRVESEKNLLEGFIYASQFSRSNEVIIEEFVKGEELSIDAFVFKGKAKIILISKSEKLMDNNRSDFPIHRSIAPFLVTNKQRLELQDIVQNIATAFGLRETPLLVQCIITDNEISVLELSARTGGGSKHYLIKAITGFDVIQGYLDTILKKEISQKTREFDSDKKYLMEYIYTQPGMFNRLEGFESLMLNGTIDAFYQYKTTGMEIFGASNSGDRVAGVLFSGNSSIDINKKIIEFDNSVQVLDVSGSDIMLHGILPF